MLYLLDPKFLKIEKENGVKFYKGLYLCDCGKPTIVLPAKVKSGDTKSCGCLLYRMTHGVSRHPLFAKFNGMMQRCYNPKVEGYRNYGSRGITVCKEWSDDPGLFIIWAEKNGYKKGLEIDRIDNNKGYSPNNCRFVECEINQQNKRTNKLTKQNVCDIVAAIRNGATVSKLALKYNISPTMICAIKSKRTWKNITRKENQNEL